MHIFMTVHHFPPMGSDRIGCGIGFRETYHPQAAAMRCERIA